mmetsp:Transcript_8410/g.26854  ORF Transcript_8410/g.26854 Transcript_8410/m.26854 type:complete len:247 (-) Transcript_8410:78-818(-)
MPAEFLPSSSQQPRRTPCTVRPVSTPWERPLPIDSPIAPIISDLRALRAAMAADADDDEARFDFDHFLPLSLSAAVPRLPWQRARTLLAGVVNHSVYETRPLALTVTPGDEPATWPGTGEPIALQTLADRWTPPLVSAQLAVHALVEWRQDGNERAAPGATDALLTHLEMLGRRNSAAVPDLVRAFWPTLAQSSTLASSTSSLSLTRLFDHVTSTEQATGIATDVQFANTALDEEERGGTANREHE